MKTQDVANRLVELCRKGDFDIAMKELYSNEIVSIEPDGAPVKECRGIEQVTQKGEQFMSNLEEFHGNEVSDPIVADNYFSVSMKMDVTFKGMPRSTMEEVCMYQVENGKIIREEFFYTAEQEN